MSDYRVVTLKNGTRSLYSERYDEVFHPGIGPAAEGEALYVGPVRFRERAAAMGSARFVVWDIGLGGAANAIAALRATRDLATPLMLQSFDVSQEPLRAALEGAEELGYLEGYEGALRALLENGRADFQDGAHAVEWRVVWGDFPGWLGSVVSARPNEEVLPRPHAIFHDAFSPARNPEMWTRPMFAHLRALATHPDGCMLATYSRSTAVRVGLLCAGWYVGRGPATGEKEETTVAATDLGLLDAPLDARWLERAVRSTNAEPLETAVYARQALSAATRAVLERHGQFLGKG